jgi:hypothetical protein
MKFTSRMAIALVLLLFNYCLQLHAQTGVPRHEIGFGAGMFVYQGDLTPEAAGTFKSPGFAVNLFYNHLLSRSFSLRTNLAFGKLMADDANYPHPEWREHRALKFTARTTELSGLLVWNILGNNYNDRKIISPYIFGGIGLNSLRVTRDWSRFNYDYYADDSTILNGLATDTLHSVPGTIAVVPLGAGVRYAISPKISLMGEVSYRLTFNDYVDGFSEVGNPSRNDYYGSYTIGLIYTFGRDNSLKCPVMRY